MGFESSDNDVTHIEDSAYLRENEFERLLVRRVSLKIQADTLKKQIDGLNIEMAAMMLTAGIKSVHYDYGVDTRGDEAAFTVTYLDGKPTWKLSKQKLVECGVDESVINAAMVQGKSRQPTIQVRRIGAADEGDES